MILQLLCCKHNFIATAFYSFHSSVSASLSMSMSMPSSFANRKSSLKIAIYRFQPYIRSINEPSRSELCTSHCLCVCVDGARCTCVSLCVCLCACVLVCFFHSSLAHSLHGMCIHMRVPMQNTFKSTHVCGESTGETVNLSLGQITQYSSMHTWLMLTAMCTLHIYILHKT